MDNTPGPGDTATWGSHPLPGDPRYEEPRMTLRQACKKFRECVNLLEEYGYEIYTDIRGDLDVRDTTKQAWENQEGGRAENAV